jgi:hypothetical protein
MSQLLQASWDEPHGYRVRVLEGDICFIIVTPPQKKKSGDQCWPPFFLRYKPDHCFGAAGAGGFEKSTVGAASELGGAS